MPLLKKIYHPSFAHPLKILFTSRDPMPPIDLGTCQGQIIYRDSWDIVCIWNGAEWVPLNQAGWFLKYSARFPSNVRVGNWAIVGPLRQAGSKQSSSRTIDLEDFTWAMRHAGAAMESTGKVPVLVLTHIEEQEIRDVPNTAIALAK